MWGTNGVKWKKKRAMHKPACKQRGIRSAEFPRLKVNNQAQQNKFRFCKFGTPHTVEVWKKWKTVKWRTWKLQQLYGEVGVIGWQL